MLNFDKTKINLVILIYQGFRFYCQYFKLFVIYFQLHVQPKALKTTTSIYK